MAYWLFYSSPDAFQNSAQNSAQSSTKKLSNLISTVLWAWSGISTILPFVFISKSIEKLLKKRGSDEFTGFVTGLSSSYAATNWIFYYTFQWISSHIPPI